LPWEEQADQASQLIAKSKECEGTLRRSSLQQTPLKRYDYQLSGGEATQMIWKSAMVVQQAALDSIEIEDLRLSKYVGEDNVLKERIDLLKQKVGQMERRFGRQHHKVKEGRELVGKLARQKKQVEKEWKGLRERQKAIWNGAF
jgi:hypothetical protein